MFAVRFLSTALAVLSFAALGISEASATARTDKKVEKTRVAARDVVRHPIVRAHVARPHRTLVMQNVTVMRPTLVRKDVVVQRPVFVRKPVVVERSVLVRTPIKVKGRHGDRVRHTLSWSKKKVTEQLLTIEYKPVTVQRLALEQKAVVVQRPTFVVAAAPVKMAAKASKKPMK